MSGVSVLQHFEAYQKARVTFVQAVAEAATRPQNIEVMQNAGVMQLLRPLLLDNVRVLALHRAVDRQALLLLRLGTSPNPQQFMYVSPSIVSVRSTKYCTSRRIYDVHSLRWLRQVVHCQVEF